MDWAWLYQLFSSLWVVWFTMLFVGICVWALWPGRKEKLEQQGRIPFLDGE